MFPSFFKILAVLGSLPGLVHSLQVTIPNPVINVTAGHNATLYCTYSPIGTITNSLFIQWSIFEAQSQQFKTVYYFQQGQPNSEGNFLNRVTASITPGNATITISNMQPQESGFYSCEVLNPPEAPSQGKIQLTVLVAPSVPHCRIRGAVETGHYISLKCFSEEGMPRPQYTWNRVVNGVLKPTPPQMDYRRGTLIIGNMTDFADGHYRCTASNSLGNASCEIDLHTGAGEGGIIAAGVIGAVLVATIIFAIVWFLIAKKKSKKEKLPASEMKTTTPSGGNSAYAAVSEERNDPASEGMVAFHPEIREYRDQAENVASAHGEAEEPPV
ncbi:hypothetical protein FKM82_002560 [Ascaphus truei]|uniref:V-set and immunoglobulin domain-containing protein 1-like n=1 Tax=Ascaphus truei TaxID=8439 RepID=UPI003F5AC956